jgi:hypothetical protein
MMISPLPSGGGPFAPPFSPQRPEISVVIPTYDEEDNVVQITEAVIAALSPTVEHFEILVIDNGSSDRTVELVRELAERYDFVRCIVNARNFGQMRSPTHAIYNCRGAAVIGMCADFQDPPALLPKFIQHWRAGAKIVLGVRQDEASGRLLTAFRNLSYRVIASLGDVQPIAGATGFGLYDSGVVDILRTWNDPEPFFRAMLVETGFAITTVPFQRPPRERGESKNNFRGLTVFALSALPLISRNVFRLAFTVALPMAAIGPLLLLMALIASPWASNAWFWVVSAIGVTIVGAVVSLIAMLGVQVMAVSDRVRHVPLVIERERINFATRTGPAS